MPSSSNPISSVEAGSGPQGVGVSSGSGNVGAVILAHISDPTDAHAATAIGFGGSANWADGVTNPAGTVEGQLDKIVLDLATGDGAGKIAFNGAGSWADGTLNPATTVDLQIDKIITDLRGNAGSAKIGSNAISDTSVTIAAGPVFDQLRALADSANIQYNNDVNWADLSSFPTNNVQNALDALVSTVASTTGANSGTRKIGGEAIVNTSATITAGTLLSQLTLLSRSANLQYNPGPAWLGGRTNGSNTVQGQLDKIITDLAATAAGDDGAERIGAQAVGDLAGGSVRAQLNELDTNWGRLARANTWTNAQTVAGAAGDGNPALITDTLPTDRKLVWRMRNHTTLSDKFVRLYNDRNYQGFVITTNASWNGTQWVKDENTDPSEMFEFTEDGLSIFRRSSAGPWGANAWEGEGRYGHQFVNLGNTTAGGPASIVCSVVLENGRLDMQNTANVLGSDSNPPATQGHFNVLKAKNIVKMWAQIFTSFDTIEDGFNIASVSSSGNTCVVNIQSDMANDNFACVATCLSDSQVMVYVSAVTTGSVTLKGYNVSSGSQVNLASTGVRIALILIGQQDS